MIDVTALATYFAVMSITPGPNNVMVTSSGAAYGYRATLPHVLGIGLGAALQMVLVALGVGVIFQRFPLLQSGLAVAAAAYLVYLAWQLLRAGVVAETDTRRPFTVWQAVLFQAVNPKAWVMAVTTAAVFLPKDTPLSRLILVVGGLFLAVNLPCVSVWALFGSALRHLLLRRIFRRVFNLTMSILLVLTAVQGLRTDMYDASRRHSIEQDNSAVPAGSRSVAADGKAGGWSRTGL